MATEAERHAAYTAHDHNVAWNALWDRCEKAEAENARLMAALDIARTGLLKIERRCEEARAELSRAHEQSGDLHGRE